METFWSDLMGELLGAAVGSLLGAFFVMLAVHLVVKWTPTYGSAYITCFVSQAVSFVLGSALGWALIGVAADMSEGSLIALAWVLGALMGLAVQVYFSALLLLGPSGEKLTLMEAFLSTLVLLGIALAIGVVVFGIAMALGG